MNSTVFYPRFCGQEWDPRLSRRGQAANSPLPTELPPPPPLPLLPSLPCPSPFLEQGSRIHDHARRRHPYSKNKLSLHNKYAGSILDAGSVLDADSILDADSMLDTGRLLAVWFSTHTRGLFIRTRTIFLLFLYATSNYSVFFLSSTLLHFPVFVSVIQYPHPMTF